MILFQESNLTVSWVQAHDPRADSPPGTNSSLLLPQRGSIWGKPTRPSKQSTWGRTFRIRTKQPGQSIFLPRNLPTLTLSTRDTVSHSSRTHTPAVLDRNLTEPGLIPSPPELTRFRTRILGQHPEHTQPAPRIVGSGPGGCSVPECYLVTIQNCPQPRGTLFRNGFLRAGAPGCFLHAPLNSLGDSPLQSMGSHTATIKLQFCISTEVRSLRQHCRITKL